MVQQNGMGKLVQRWPARQNGMDGATGWEAGATKRDGKSAQTGMGRMVQQWIAGTTEWDGCQWCRNRESRRLVQQKEMEMPAQRNGTDGATKWDSWCNWDGRFGATKWDGQLAQRDGTDDATGWEAGATKRDG